jgi:PAS domain S-box-containing protein
MTRPISGTTLRLPRPVLSDTPEPPRPLSESWITDDVVWGLVDAAPDGIVMVDRAGQIVLVNRQTEELFGYDRGELLGRSVEELIPERFRTMHRAHRTRFVVEPQTRPMGAGIELVARRHDGEEFRAEISLSPLLVGAELYVVAAVRDITHRVAAEARTRRIQELLDSTRDGIYISDAETLRFTYVNQGAVDQVGYSRESLMRMSMLHVAPEFDEAGWRALLEPLKRGSVSSTMLTTKLVGRDGVDIPAEVLLQTEKSDDDSAASAFVCVVRDVRERAEAEERLRHADQELRVLADRERIARDLHDTVIQRLFAAGMTLQAISEIPGQRTESTARIEAVVDELDETIRELRSTIYGLQARRSPRPALRSEIVITLEDARHALGTTPLLDLAGDVDEMPDETARELLATLREALSNVARHAHAGNVEVVVDCGEEVVLRVVDDGVGIPDEPPPGNGLRNMAERADRLGGRCDVRAGEPSGTIVEWRVPNASVRTASSGRDT